MIIKIKNFFRLILFIFKIYGFNSKRFITSLFNTIRFYKEIRKYNNLNAQNSNFKIKIKSLAPILHDYNDSAGKIGVYFIQDLWAAKKIYKYKPDKHIDIGSRIDGFISHLLIFMDVTVVDIRGSESNISGLNFIKNDATNLKDFEDESLKSISSLHAAEHFGLGRYGDEIDPSAHIKFMNNLQRVLKKNGKLLFSVPLGNDEIFFNSHRAFKPSTILETFNKLSLISFSTIDKQNNLIENIKYNSLDNIFLYKIGLFEFEKK